MEKLKKIKLGLTIGIAVALIVLVALYLVTGKQAFIRTALSGLTLGALFFLVAAGLTRIFGLMDVLNFAHGSMFMLGAYIGWQFYTNPTFIFGMLPAVLSIALGLMLIPLMKPYLVGLSLSDKVQKNLPKLLYVLALLAAVIAFWKFDIMGLAKTAMVAITTTNSPLSEISTQEPMARFWIRPLMLAISGLLLAVAISKPGDKTQFVPNEKLSKNLLVPIVIFVSLIASILVREKAPEVVLLMNGNLRFVFSIIAAVVFGLLFGAIIEITMIRPLYIRPFFIVLMTLGLSYVIRELVQLLWDPLAYQMSRPPLFATAGKAALTVGEWLRNGSSTINISGVVFPTYRLFVILLGVVMFIFVTVLMTKTRLGMIIRAGVQDPQMVEALGINVKSVFTLVFALGVALAALGGIGAAPFLPITPLMGDGYLMQGFITVVIGGMGSYVGAFVGALILGMARAFGDYYALKLSLSPAIAEASTVIIMIIVLLLRPQGLFGKKE